MKKVIVKNLQGVEIGRCDSVLDADSWIDECIKNKCWGNPERDEIGEDGEPTGKILPAEYTIEVEDISDKLEQERVNRESLEYLASTDWLVIRELDAGIPCPADVKQARAEARARIVR